MWEEETIKRKTVENISIYDEIKKLNKKLRKVSKNSEKYSFFWNLKENYALLKFNYKILNRYSRETSYEKEFINTLCQEIYYFEKCLNMLREKYGESYIDFRHYLNVAILEYQLFIEKELSFPKRFQKLHFKSSGVLPDPELNMIVNNILNAEVSLQNIINLREKEGSYKELFLFYEILGDLFIQIYALLNVYYTDESFQVFNNLVQAYKYYKISYKYKKMIETTSTYIDGLHGIPYLQNFYDFFNEIYINIHNVKKKIEFLEEKYKKID